MKQILDLKSSSTTSSIHVTLLTGTSFSWHSCLLLYYKQTELVNMFQLFSTLLIPCIFPQSIHQLTNALNKIHFNVSACLMKAIFMSLIQKYIDKVQHHNPWGKQFCTCKFSKSTEISDLVYALCMILNILCMFLCDRPEDSFH